MGRSSQLCGMMCAVCFIVFLKPCGSCQALAEAVQQNSTLTDLDLYENNVGPEGAKAWCLDVFGLFGEDGVMRGEGVKKGTGRIKTQPFEGKQCSVESQVQMLKRVQKRFPWESRFPKVTSW